MCDMRETNIETTTHYISYRKFSFPRTIRIEFAIPAKCKHEARTIAEKEVAALKGWRYMGGN
jgi:hypothetical protein